MARVEVRPSGIVLDVDEGESIIAAAWRHGYLWPTVCGGQGTCRACVLRVDDGATSFSPVSRWEREGLADVTPTLPGDPGAYRLACQATVTGDAVVHKPGVRPGPGAPLTGG